MSEVKQCYTTDEAAAYIGIGRRELLRLVERGYVRKLRGFGKPFRFSKYELDRYLKGEGAT